MSDQLENADEVWAYRLTRSSVLGFLQEKFGDRNSEFKLEVRRHLVVELRNDSATDADSTSQHRANWFRFNGPRKLTDVRILLDHLHKESVK